MSEVKVNKLSPRSGTTVTLGDSGDTISIPSGVTLSNAGTNTFASATITGDLTVDTNTLYVDSTNNRVGIGTSSPSEVLHVVGDILATGGDFKSDANNYLGFSNDTFARFVINDSEKMRILSSGNVGIGTTSPNRQLTVQSTTNAEFSLTAGNSSKSQIFFADTDDTNIGRIEYEHTNNAAVFWTNDAERMRIDSSGNVGIGETSMDALLVIKGNSDTTTTPSIRLKDGSDTREAWITNHSGDLELHCGDNDNVPHCSIKMLHGNIMTFRTANTERMRIDSSGNVLVGKTTSTYATDGITLNPEAILSSSNTSEISAIFNRNSTEGDIVNFRKDGTTVGSIGIKYTNNLYISNPADGIGLGIGDDNLYPTNGGGTTLDNAIDLGDSSVRFQDIYATNGTIQTSDQNEKQSIQSLTTAEMNVAKRLSPLIKTFKWNSAVEEKGDSARTHTGIIAQDVQQAFTDEGLDAGNYALFCSDTWWEKEISVDAVAEEVDEDGNVTTEAKDAYTYIDTKEEATDGYTERTRLGVRYPELLSFIQAYNDQRFTELEARITILENA